MVGLMSEDPREVLTEGAQLLHSAQVGDKPHMLGHVTSSYHSACIGRSIALAMVEGCSVKEGQTVHAWDGGKVIAAKIVSPVFLDPEGKRHNV